VRIVWTTIASAGHPAGASWPRVTTACGAAAVSPEASTDQTAAAIAVTSDLTTLILRSSLKLCTRTFD
jgi:hypothetical protein